MKSNQNSIEHILKWFTNYPKNISDKTVNNIEKNGYYAYEDHTIDWMIKYYDNITIKNYNQKEIIRSLSLTSEKILDYVIGFLTNKHKIGMNDKNILRSLCRAFDFKQKDAYDGYNKGYSFIEIYNKLSNGESFDLEYFRPFRPMLAHNYKEGEIPDEKSHLFWVEKKMDGKRIIVHKKGDKLIAYSRLQKEHILPSFIRDELLNIPHDFILDGELIVGEGKQTDEFQKVMTLSGKYDIDKKAKELDVKYFVFDVLKIKDEDWYNKNYAERTEAIFRDVLGYIRARHTFQVKVAPFNNSKDFYEEVIKSGGEGVMYKNDDDVYHFDDRKHWIKHKGTNTCEVMLYKLSDTTERSDRYAKFGFGGFCMALLKDGKLIDCGVVGNGLSEEEWHKLKDMINNHQRPIVEIRFSDLTMPRENSYKFRFARMIKIRDDKTQPDSIEQLNRDFGIKRL